MTDPYKVLDIPASATDEEVKAAYRKLAGKYHPDQYNDSPLRDLANEKMKEINEAYDTIVSQRKQGNTGGGYSAGNGYYAGNPYNGAETGGSSEFSDVRSYIRAGRTAEAEQILNGVPQNSRNAEWHFLKGTILYSRGWAEEAKNHFTRACQMDPGNAEYNMALKRVMNQGQGMYGGYMPNMNQNVGGCTPCDICNGLLCADCCCGCMGGNLIPCC